MRTLLVVAVLGAACLLISANTSSAADHGQVPASMLAQMGLGGMQPMSDAQGLSIRGMGRGGTIQVNAVVQVGRAGSANGGNGGSFGGGNGGGNGDVYTLTPVGGANGGNGGSAGSVYFNNDVATFIQVNVSRGSLLGGFR